MSMYLGVDTSNYTTSVAIFDSDDNSIINRKKLLPVESGQIGLMQSKALFNHIRQLPEVVEAAFSSLNCEIRLNAVGCSQRPRDVKGSYMPVFLAGEAVAASIASSMRIPLYGFSHQAGHIVAALYSADRLDLLQHKFIAFHVSGGTTEAVLVEPSNENIVSCEIVAKTLDLKAGQAIDRIGAMLNLPFPSGKFLDELSLSGKLTKKVQPVLKGNDCCLSGLENICEKMIAENEKPEDVARFAIEYVYYTIYLMSNLLKEKFNNLPIVYAGGVMSNSIISNRLKSKNSIFADAEFSSDNAAGIAVMAFLNDKGLKQ